MLKLTFDRELRNDLKHELILANNALLSKFIYFVYYNSDIDELA